MQVFNGMWSLYAHRQSLYRLDFVIQWLRMVLMSFMMYYLWSTLYVENPSLVGLDLRAMATYGIMGALLAEVMRASDMRLYIRDQVRKGQIEHDLTKPINLQWYLFCRDASQRALLCVTVLLPVLVGAVLLQAAALPASWIAGGMALASLLLAYLVMFAIDFLFCMAQLVAISVSNIYFVFAAVSSCLAGNLFPLWLLPDWARNLVYALPFRCMFDIPLGIYTGRTIGALALQGLLLQCVWAVVLLLLGQLAWKHVSRRLVIQGG